MSGFADIARVFVVGVVGIGMATALFAPGRTTVQAGQAVFTGANNLLRTAETGR
jgi:formate-dependent nitrite reductase membrane component NrfD